MDLLKIAFDISRGIGDAYFNQRLREGNRDANLGMNHFFFYLTQCTLFDNTFFKINEILQNIPFANTSPLPSRLTNSISLYVPVSLIFAKKCINFTNHPNIHNIITNVSNHILPNLIFLTNLVTSVAYIVFGNPLFGGSNLLFLLLNLSHEKGWINTDFLQKNVILSGFLEASTITKVIHALIVNRSLNPYNLWILTDKIYQTINYLKRPAAIKISSITLNEYESKYSESSNILYRLHEYHLLKDPVSNRPLENITSQINQNTSAVTEYLKQDLSIYNMKLLKKFRNEEKWKQNYNNNPMEYLIHGINNFLCAIKISTNLEFKNKSLHLIHYILNLPQDDQIDIFANLAVTGHYCPERLYSDINLYYDTYIDTLATRELNTKIITILHKERLQILDQFLSNINNLKSLINSMVTSNSNTNVSQFIRKRFTLQVFSSLMPSMEDIHFANSAKNILHPYFYTHHKSIDTLTDVNRKDLNWILDTWFYQKIGIIELAESLLSQQYSPGIVLKRISNIIEKEPTISTSEIELWFVEQYMSDNPEATRSKAEEWVQERVYAFDDNYIPRLKPYYLLFFLVNQGVLKIEDSPSENQNPHKLTQIIHSLSSFETI